MGVTFVIDVVTKDGPARTPARPPLLRSVPSGLVGKRVVLHQLNPYPPTGIGTDHPQSAWDTVRTHSRPKTSVMR